MEYFFSYLTKTSGALGSDKALKSVGSLFYKGFNIAAANPGKTVGAAATGTTGAYKIANYKLFTEPKVYELHAKQIEINRKRLITYENEIRGYKRECQLKQWSEEWLKDNPNRPLCEHEAFIEHRRKMLDLLPYKKNIYDRLLELKKRDVKEWEENPQHLELALDSAWHDTWASLGGSESTKYAVYLEQCSPTTQVCIDSLRHM